MVDELWKLVCDSVRPLKKKNKNVRDVSVFVPVKNMKQDVDVSFVSEDYVAKLKRKKRYILEKELSLGDVSRIDKASYKMMTRGRFDIDARLDLHGCTLDSAFVKFVNFINKNFELGNRHLLVITGKGNPQKNTGVIKNYLPVWLSNESVNPFVLYAGFALLKDGGDGAFYILLRKK